MTDKVKLLFYIPLIFICLFSHRTQLSGQEKINISAGMGFPELINLGFRYQIRQVQTGISFGAIPNNVISVSGDVYFHVAGLSELSNRRPWYGRIGLIYFRDEDIDRIRIDHYLNLRLGREFNISKRIGINLDAGVIFEQHTKIKYKTSYAGGGMFGPVSIPILPGIGIGLFYRM